MDWKDMSNTDVLKAWEAGETVTTHRFVRIDVDVPEDIRQQERGMQLLAFAVLRIAIDNSEMTQPLINDPSGLADVMVMLSRQDKEFQEILEAHNIPLIAESLASMFGVRYWRNGYAKVLAETAPHNLYEISKIERTTETVN